MTPEQLSELEQLEKAATCAPWKGDEFEAVAPKAQTAIPGNVKMVWAADYHMNEWDAKFVLALRNAAPSLFQSLRSLMTENEALKTQFEDMNTQRENAIEAYGRLRFEQTSGKVCPACGDSYANKEERLALKAENEALKKQEEELGTEYAIVCHYKNERDSLQAQLKDAVDALSAVQVDAIQCPQQQGEIIQFVVTAWAIGKVRKTLAKLGAAQKEGG